MRESIDHEDSDIIEDTGNIATLSNLCGQLRTQTCKQNRGWHAEKPQISVWDYVGRGNGSLENGRRLGTQRVHLGGKWEITMAESSKREKKGVDE